MRAVLFVLLLALNAAARAADTDKPCAWLVEPTADRENILFPEITTRYLAAPLPAVPGGYVEVSGDFPQARYMSLQTYGVTLQTISVLHDEQIAPDPGSSNPYLPGADRSVAARHYTVRVIEGLPPPSGPEPNTLYYRGSDAIHNGFSLVYRIYLPDAGTQPFGAVAPPALSEVLPGGLRIPVPTCPDPVPDTTFLTLALGELGLAEDPLPDLGAFARATPVWHKYVNAPTGYTDGFTDNPALGALNPALRAVALKLPAGLGENADNKYVYAMLSREFGNVAVLRAKLPSTPKTYDAEPVMGSGQMRFWSMCSGNRATFTYACLVDQQVPVDAAGNFTIAVSSANDRPKNATPDCGVGWLPWGADLQDTLIMRNMLPAPDFPHAVQAADQGNEPAVLGDYYPQGSYFANAEDFDAAYPCTAATEKSAARGGGALGALDPRLLTVLLLGVRRRKS